MYIPSDLIRDKKVREILLYYDARDIDQVPFM